MLTQMHASQYGNFLTLAGTSGGDLWNLFLGILSKYLMFIFFNSII